MAKAIDGIHTSKKIGRVFVAVLLGGQHLLRALLQQIHYRLDLPLLVLQQIHYRLDLPLPLIVLHYLKYQP